MTTPRKRVISGMRPTGRLHIGHYFGALANWVKLQNDPAYECFYFIADWHALTSDYADTSQIAQNTIEIATDWLAVGLDPQKSTFFVQSQVPEHAELHLLLSMITPLGWLERVPTYKEQLDNMRGKDLHTYGFLGYPVLQTADIVIYSQEGVAMFVPVGEDQISHVEFSREVVRRFNAIFGFEAPESSFLDERAAEFLASIVSTSVSELRASKGAYRRLLKDYATEMGMGNFIEKMGKNSQYFKLSAVLSEPQVLVTETPRIPGLDGRKMSKSYGNAIMLSEDDDSIRTKTKVMVTDPARKRRTDPGNPDICPVYDWHKLFSPQETLDWSAHGCRTAGIGCIECKSAMADHLIKRIAPIRGRRQEYEAHPDKVREILAEGSKKARKVAQTTMERVREAVFGANASDVAPGAQHTMPTAAKPTGAGN